MKRLSLIIMLFCLFLSLSSCNKVNRITKPVLGTDEYIEKNYVDLETINFKVPSKKRNLIHFYLESIENSFFDKSNGGNLEENLMPELLKVSDELIKDGKAFSFSHKSRGYGGPLVTYGAEWSIASMVNQFFGFPMLTEEPRNKYGSEDHFYPGAVGVGDILNKLGYEQTVMFGARKTFGALGYLFEDHGFDRVMDYYYCRDHKMLPSRNYFVNWGYEDQKLYEFAKEEILRMNATGKPFHFMMENADTHYPGYHFNADGTPDFYNKEDRDYAKTITYSDKMVAEFIRWCTKQDFFKDTTIIVIGDHNSMDKKFFQEHDFKGFERTTFNLIINPGELIDPSNSKFINREFATYDLLPTIMKSINLDFEGERLGLGTNLFSQEKTLYELDGYKYVNGLYKKKSYYYVNRFINGKVNYDGKNLITSNEA